MLILEKYYGIKIEELLRRLYVDDNMLEVDIAKKLKLNKITIQRWMKKAGIYSRNLKIK